MDRIVCRDRRSCVSAGDKRGRRLRRKPGRRAGGRGRAGRQTPRGSLTWLQVFLLELRQPFGACPQDGDAEGAGGRENTGSASRVCLKRVACVPAPRHVIVGGRDDTSCSGEAGPNTCADLGHGGDRPSPQLPRTDPPSPRLHTVFFWGPEGRLGGRGPHTPMSQKWGARVLGRAGAARRALGRCPRLKQAHVSVKLRKSQLLSF